ncbi:MAG: cytochrome c [Acidobacteria bacterium]|nr:cytochrome c [Acidobacteriota bacterium]
MKPTGAAVLVLALVVSLGVSSQQPGSTKLPLAITEKDAVDEWSRTIWDGPLDPKLPSDTAFLLSLSETELLGRFRFRQRCALCHAAQTNLSTVTWGPLLTQRNVTGREAAVRQRILDGSPRMPAFKYALDTPTIDAIIAYLKKVERLP